MEIIHASSMGYCMGVKRAVESAEKALDQYPDKTVYTLGPLIHNKVALKALAEKGLKILSSDEVS
ncbi:MAG: 4-hydroxy-3-methylbut-2-enyl diphosphate reductase, partial [Treponemataceae bacterium]|nr:4-hydroxy-3-methylbut-2-enyl diphosphate reductase [Treponemataceae bacterium]